MPRLSRVAWGGSGLLVGIVLGLFLVFLIALGFLALMAHSFPHLTGGD